MCEYNNRNTGTIGEDIAAGYLSTLGYEIIKRNFQYSNFGEIDIIAKDKNVLVFVEVKANRTSQFGNPVLRVGISKQRQIYKVAQIYMLYNNIRNTDCRFDVIAIEMGYEKNEITHIENAFSIVL
ncbi:MAG: YraN family protein [Candidatus Delongbacteria bacterium]|nr:YraN family protein [Candidatus Delongbacteria bacterium]